VAILSPGNVLGSCSVPTERLPERLPKHPILRGTVSRLSSRVSEFQQASALIVFFMNTVAWHGRTKGISG